MTFIPVRSIVLDTPVLPQYLSMIESTLKLSNLFDQFKTFNDQIYKVRMIQLYRVASTSPSAQAPHTLSHSSPLTLHAPQNLCHRRFNRGSRGYWHHHFWPSLMHVPPGNVNICSRKIQEQYCFKVSRSGVMLIAFLNERSLSFENHTFDIQVAIPDGEIQLRVLFVLSLIGCHQNVTQTSATLASMFP